MSAPVSETPVDWKALAISRYERMDEYIRELAQAKAKLSQVERERDGYMAQAEFAANHCEEAERACDALAEALVECVESLTWARALIGNIPEHSAYNEGITQARAALAQWEEAKSPDCPATDEWAERREAFTNEGEDRPEAH